jgi:hypothetical protein
MTRRYATAIILLLLFYCTGSTAEKAVYAKEFVTISQQENTSADSAWEERYIMEARSTIEMGVMSLLKGLTSAEQLCDSVALFRRTWSDWAHSRLFILQDDKDIDVYGNLYSLQVLCRTLVLTAEDWHTREQTSRSEEVLEQAYWLEEQSRLLAEPVAEIISRQSYSDYLPRRIEIMKQQFSYVDTFYQQCTKGKKLR